MTTNTAVYLDACDWMAAEADLAARYQSDQAFSGGTHHDITTTGGKYGGGSIKLVGVNAPDNLKVPFTSVSRAGVHFLWKGTRTGTYGTSNEGVMVGLYTAAGAGHICLTFDPFDDKVRLRAGGSVINTVVAGPTVLDLDDGVYHDIEIRHQCMNLEGWVRVYIDNVLFFSWGDAAAGTPVDSKQTDAGDVALLIFESNKRTTGQYVEVQLDDISVFQWSFPSDGLQGYVDPTSSSYANIGSGNQGYAALRKVSMVGGQQIVGIGIYAGAAAPTGKIRGVIYADNSGSPVGGALLAQSAEVTGWILGRNQLPFTSIYTPVGATDVWIGVYFTVITLNLQSGLASYSAHFHTISVTTADATFAADSSGSASWGFWAYNNDWAPAFRLDYAPMGPMRAYTLRPSSDSAAAWTKSTGANNFGTVDDPTYDITDYVSSATANQEDLYGTGGLPANPARIFAVQVVVNGVKASGTSCSVKASLKSASTTSRGTAVAFGATVLAATALADTDPNGNIQWTKAAVDAALGGEQLSATAGSGTARVGQAMIEVLVNASLQGNFISMFY